MRVCIAPAMASRLVILENEMFGIDPKQVQWMVDSVAWMVKAIQAIAKKREVDLVDPPQKV